MLNIISIRINVMFVTTIRGEAFMVGHGTQQVTRV